jgi:hypothetical protein
MRGRPALGRGGALLRRQWLLAAPDPSDPDRVCLAGGNEHGRGNGERMTVDPNDGNVLYPGTRQAGLWKSTDRAATPTRANSGPTQAGRGFGNRPSQGSGIVFTIFDPRSGSEGRPSSIDYIGASPMGRENLFRSTDAGQTWLPVPGQPTQPGSPF